MLSIYCSAFLLGISCLSSFTDGWCPFVPPSLHNRYPPTCYCKELESCEWGSWGDWSHLSDGTCGEQTRKRHISYKYRTVTREYSCSGVSTSCDKENSPEGRKSVQRCMCPIVECQREKTWSSWHDNGKFNSDNCPIEERVKKIHIINHYLLGFGPCKDYRYICGTEPKQTRDRVISCPTLKAPINGQLESDSCISSNNHCGSICIMQCNKGYEVIGNRYATCNIDGDWDRPLATCKDRVPPSIKCPSVNDYSTLPNKNYAEITLPLATATDNSGVTPTITKDHSSPVRVDVFKPVPVVYKAKDEEGNEDSCKIMLTVIDTEPPKIISCPSDMTVTPPSFPHEVNWTEPLFHDNVDGYHVTKYQNYINGQAFPEGTREVKVCAKDSSYNEACCRFQLQVSKAKCPLYDAPQHGSKSCNIHKSLKNETYVCSVGCESGYQFPKLPGDVTFYNFYLCGEDGLWHGQKKFDPMNMNNFVPIPKNQRPWPECAKITDISKRGDPGLEGDCVTDEEKEVIKQHFIDQLKSDLILKNLYCNVGDDCVTSNVVVTCDASKSIVIDFKPLQSNHFLPMNIPQSVIQKVRGLLQELADRKNLEIDQKEAKYKCVQGSVLLSAKFTSSGKEECVLCPVGTYHNPGTNTCEKCPIGQYQSLDGQRDCVKCADKLSTISTGSTKEADCKPICNPGSYSKNGLATCLACKTGSYQPLDRQTTCIKCPEGTTTDAPGSLSAKNCQ